MIAAGGGSPQAKVLICLSARGGHARHVSGVVNSIIVSIMHVIIVEVLLLLLIIIIM